MTSLHPPYVRGSEQKSCYVYLIEAEWRGSAPMAIEGIWQEIVKVGISDSPNSRLASFATACPFPISLVKTWRLPSRQAAQQIERGVHKCLSHYKTHGEWFLTSAVAVLCTVDYELLDYFAERRGHGIEGCVPHLLQAGVALNQMADLIGSVYGETPACLHEGSAGIQ